MKTENYVTIQKEFLKRGFDVIKRYKKAFIVRNEHQQIAMAVLDPKNKKKAICMPLVFKHKSDETVYPIKYNQVLHTAVNFDLEYRDLMEHYNSVV